MDFVRGITPLVVELFEIILKNKGKLDINNYCKKNDRDVRVWDETKVIDKLPGKDVSIKEIVNKEYQSKHSDNSKVGDFKLNMIYSEALMYLIKNLIEDTLLVETVSKVRKVEEDIRNLAAHDIVSLDSDYIRKKTKSTPIEIMDMIKILFSRTNFSIKKEDWNSYENMNEELKRRISEHREEEFSC